MHLLALGWADSGGLQSTGETDASRQCKDLILFTDSSGGPDCQCQHLRMGRRKIKLKIVGSLLKIWVSSKTGGYPGGTEALQYQEI